MLSRNTEEWVFQIWSTVKKKVGDPWLSAFLAYYTLSIKIIIHSTSKHVF